jgi:hypothetical protein
VAGLCLIGWAALPSHHDPARPVAVGTSPAAPPAAFDTPASTAATSTAAAAHRSAPSVASTPGVDPTPARGPHDTSLGLLRLERLGITADVVTVSSPNRVLGVPEDPAQVGWWSSGAAPGAGHGTIVIDGHVNYAGQDGALSVLPALRAGDRVTVQISAGSPQRTYLVKTVQQYAKHPGLPATIFDQNGPERLALITCGGPFDPSTGSYEDNVVVTAYPA